MKQVFSNEEIKIDRVAQIVREKIGCDSYGKFYEKVLFASVLFELGIECSMKFGDARVLHNYRIAFNVLTDDWDNYHCWIELDGDIIDLTLGVMVNIYMFDRNTRLCFDCIEIVEQESIPLKLSDVYFRYKPFSIKNGKQSVGVEYCNSNMTLYKDLEVCIDFIALAKELAHKYRLEVDKY